MAKIGVLLTNTGTPDAPTTKAVRRYLREFLSDRRIVQIPRIVWLPILYGLVLTTRPRKSAKLYQQIWTPDGSPMRVLMQRLLTQFRAVLKTVPVEIGMNYGNPSIADAIEKLHQQQVDEIIVLPLFPQFSHTSTSSSFDRVKTKTATRYIEHYYNHPAYIRALANSVKKAWHENEPAEHLLISFHGIPKRLVAQGDPYAEQCEQTAKLLANELQLASDKWTLCFQSQFGYDKWLTPSTQHLFQTLPQTGIKDIDVVCPGFAIDCLETLEEIKIRGKESFIRAGGKSIRYIPALNDSAEQIKLLTELVSLAPSAREVFL